MIDGSSFSGLLTRVEIGHMRIGSDGNGRIWLRGSGSSANQRAYCGVSNPTSGRCANRKPDRRHRVYKVAKRINRRQSVLGHEGYDQIAMYPRRAARRDDEATNAPLRDVGEGTLDLVGVARVKRA
jgi:hypothetical protein